jgi:poly(A) polymerase
LFDEILKLLLSGDGWQTFQLLRQYGLLNYLLPLTAESLRDDSSGTVAKMLEISLQNTDQRIQDGKSVMPAFLYAVLLWHKVQLAAQQLQDNGNMPEMQALNLAASDALRDQVDFTAVPRRYSNITREIWGLQSRFRQRDLRRATALLGNPRFRAAFDFLCLRAQAGEAVQDDCEWWTKFQQAAPEERQALCKNNGKKTSSLRRKKRRKKPANPASSSGE